MELDFNLLHGCNLSETILLFASRIGLSGFAENNKYPVSLEWREDGSFFEIFESYRKSCEACLMQIEKIFDIKISKDFKYGQAKCDLHKIFSIVGEELSRARPIVLSNPRLDNNKGLQMLCSPGYWATSQNQLFAFVCAEIQFIRSAQESDGEIVLHEIGPGCGYIMKLLSSLKNVSVNGSDCYDIDSYDIKKIKKNGSNYLDLDSRFRMELFSYYLSNKELGSLKSIFNSPVRIDAFSVELMSSDIIYSHLPVIDQCGGGSIWGSREWMSFFENVFTSPISKVQSIVISRNAHSAGLCSDHFQTLSSSVYGINVYDNICNGNVVVVRRR